MTFRRVPIASFLAALAVLASARPASARQSLRTILMPVVPGFGVPAKDANTVEDVLHDALDQTNLKVLSKSAAKKVVSDQQVKDFTDCQQQEDCMLKITTDIDTDVVVSALLTHEGNGSAISVKVLVGRASEVVSRTKEFVKSEDELFDTAAALAKAVADGVKKSQTLSDRASGKKKAVVEAPVTGSLSIATDPVNATLDVIDPSGVKVTQRAPYHNDFAALGKWKIVAHSPDCADDTRTVEVSSSMGSDISIALKHLTGLRITGEPDGAAVSVTGPGGFHDIRGLPWEDMTVPRGPYRIHVTHAGYLDDNETVTVASDHLTAIHVSLAKVVPPPAGATTDMIQITAGQFHIGSEDGMPDEHPVTPVILSPYWIDKTEVTVAAYETCVRAGVCEEPNRVDWTGARESDRIRESAACNWGVSGRENHPVNCVDWNMADAFCRWAGKTLPTEAQWEFAARGTDDRAYPWGNDVPDEKRANACGTECQKYGKDMLGRENWKAAYDTSDGFATTAPAGSFPAGASAFGVLDMAGNVWEWVADSFGYYSGTTERDPLRDSGTERVVRGGGWNTGDLAALRASHRRSVEPGYRGAAIGFRCAKKE